MDLKRKLAGLGAPLSRAEVASRASPASGETAPQAAAQADGTGPSAPPSQAARAAAQKDQLGGDRDATLGALRARMERILGRPVEPPRPPADPSQSDLPFLREEDDDGVVYRRCQRLPPSHHVGRMPVDAAKHSSGEMLALLALDPELARVDFERALYVDTETTGLGGGAGVLAFLVGLSWFHDGALHIEQLLLRRPADEPAMLRKLHERFEAASAVVSYNGKTFDLPLLGGRMVMNHMPALPARPHLDLLHLGRRLHKARLGACRLKSLESDVLGFVRGPDIEGGEIGPRYAHFLRTGDEAALSAVVDHNALDVVSMAALVGLYGEPLTALHTDDLVGLARTFKRAKALDQAHEAASVALAQGATEAHRVRGEIAKARGDRASALADFEALSASVDDAAVRLELAKLYEHHVKQPAVALELVAQGTGEAPEALERRRARLERKLARAATLSAKSKRRGQARRAGDEDPS